MIDDSDLSMDQEIKEIVLKNEEEKKSKSKSIS
jgi:hypothetical protein